MADYTGEIEVDGSTKLSAENWNNLVAAVNTKFDSDDVGLTPGKLVAVGVDGLIDPSLYVAGGGSGGSGSVSGPVSTTVGYPALWDNISGTLLGTGSANMLLPIDGTDTQVLKMDGSAPAWADDPLPDPSAGTDGQVVTIASGAYVLASSSLEAAINAIATETDDLSVETKVPVVQGGTLYWLNIGENESTFDPSAIVTTDALGALQTTDYATFATAIGLGTSDTVQFGSINLGHATANTLTASSGDLSIEGNIVYRAGGTDVPVTDGGTGSSSAAGAATNLGLGTGSSPQFTAVNLGHATNTTLGQGSAAGIIAVEGVDITPHIPQTNKSAAYTLVLADANTRIFHPAADTTARTWTIPANASVAYPIGTWIGFMAEGSSGTITIAITSDTLVLAGSGSTGSRTLAAHGWATATKVTSTKWYINGTGLT
jgi:hypothetical protein